MPRKPVTKKPVRSSADWSSTDLHKSSTTSRKRLRVALALAILGHEVLPIDPRTRLPACDPDGGKALELADASNRSSVIKAWWRMMPGAWVGVRGPAGWVAFDGCSHERLSLHRLLAAISGDPIRRLVATPLRSDDLPLYSKATGTNNPLPFSPSPTSLSEPAVHSSYPPSRPSSLASPATSLALSRPALLGGGTCQANLNGWAASRGLLDTLGMRLLVPVADKDDLAMKSPLRRGVWADGYETFGGRAAGGERDKAGSKGATRIKDGVRAWWGAGEVKVEFEVGRVALGTLSNHIVDVPLEAAMAAIRSVTEELFPETTLQARQNGLGWETYRVDMAVNVPARVGLLVEALRLSTTPRVRKPATTRGCESVSWESDDYALRCYDRALKTALVLAGAARSHGIGVKDRAVKEAKRIAAEHPPGTLARIEVSLRRGGLLANLAGALEEAESGDPGLHLAFGNEIHKRVLIDYPRMHRFLAGEVAKLDGVAAVLEVDGGKAAGPAKSRDALAAMAVALHPELMDQVSYDSALRDKVLGDAALLRFGSAVPDLLALAWPASEPEVTIYNEKVS